MFITMLFMIAKKQKKIRKSINWLMDRQSVVYPYDNIIQQRKASKQRYRLQRGWTSMTLQQVKEASHRRLHTLLYDSIHRRCPEERNPGASLVAQMVKNPPAMQETQVPSLGREDPLEKGMLPHSSIFAWRIPWTEEPGGPQSMGPQRVGPDWVTNDIETENRLVVCLGQGGERKTQWRAEKWLPMSRRLLGGLKCSEIGLYEQLNDSEYTRKHCLVHIKWVHFYGIEIIAQ